MTSEWAPPELQDREPTAESELLAAMSLVRAQITALPGDDFAGRYALERRLDDLRTRLHEATADDLEAANDEWAERAGRKGEHTQNVDALEAMARMMPSQGAGGT